MRDLNFHSNESNNVSTIGDSLEKKIIDHRISVTPEYNGGFHAAVYHDSCQPIANGEGHTPSTAVDAAIGSLDKSIKKGTIL